MARARNVKPGFFINPELVELPFEFRLLFIGLWTLADREGRLEDRPKRIKMALFPADNIDCEAGLAALAKAGFILRYDVSGMALVQIINWHKHQTPHPREQASALLAAPNAAMHEQSPTKDIPSSEMQGSESMSLDIPSSEKEVASPSGSSDSLIPSSLIPEKSISPKNGSGLKHTVPVDNSKNQLAQKSNSKPQPDLKAQWWRSNAGIEATARALHVKPKPGETHVELKQRCFAKIHPKEGRHAP
jgi:hypothetical protein